MNACYLSPARRKELEWVLPELAFVANTLHAQGPHGEPPVLAIRRFESGYSPIYTRASAADLNAGRGVTPEQAKCMLVGSMFGWDVPGADPRNNEAAPVRSRVAKGAAS